jgi:hypothetical protein
MISDVYHIEGIFPDPQEIESKLKNLKADPGKEKAFKEALDELKSAGMDTNPILSRFFVES